MTHNDQCPAPFTMKSHLPPTGQKPRATMRNQQGKQYKSQAEGNSPDMDCSLLLCQEFEEVLDGTSLSSFEKFPQIVANPQYDCYWCYLRRMMNRLI